MRQVFVKLALVISLTALGEGLGYAWSVINHLMGVKNSPELRAAHQAVQQDVVTAFMTLGQSVPIYRALVALRDGAECAVLESKGDWLQVRDAERRTGWIRRDDAIVLPGPVAVSRSTAGR